MNRFEQISIARNSAGLNSQIQQLFTFGLCLDFRNLNDVIVYGRGWRFRFLVHGKLNSCVGYNCWHRINRHHDPSIAVEQFAKVAFTFC
jgi:hypothetical protein